jgi:hypothetical protein
VRRSLPTLLVLTLLLAACGGTTDDARLDDGVVEPDGSDADGTDAEADDDASDDPAAGPTDGSGDAAGGGDTELAGALDPHVQDAIDQLAADEGVDRGQIEVVLAQRVTWPDGSIGCPEPGMMYTQALVEGYRILLAVHGEEVAYHGQGNQPPFRCDDPQEPTEGGGATM